MFGNNPSTAMTSAAPLTMEQILGLSATEANILEGLKLWPKGRFVFALTAVDMDEYEIRQEDHPMVGQKAPRMELSMQCLAAGAGLRDGDDKVLSAEAGAQWVNEVLKESVLFGNDGMPSKKDPNVLAYAGRDKIFTILARLFGKEAYDALVAETGGNLGKLLEKAVNRPFGAFVSHNVNPNDPNKRKQHQLALFEDFIEIGNPNLAAYEGLAG